MLWPRVCSWIYGSVLGLGWFLINRKRAGRGRNKAGRVLVHGAARRASHFQRIDRTMWFMVPPMVRTGGAVQVVRRDLGWSSRRGSDHWRSEQVVREVGAARHLKTRGIEVTCDKFTMGASRVAGPGDPLFMYYEPMDPCDHDMVKWHMRCLGSRDLELAMMTSAYLLDEPISSKDDVNSKLQYIQQSTRSARAGSAMMKSAVTSAISRELQCNQQLILEVSDSKTMTFGLIDTTAFCLRAKIQQMLFASITSSRKIPVARYQSQSIPVASYSAPSRRLQCFAYPVAGNPDAGKADVVKICKPVDKESNTKKQRK
ncbi:hypothetical protein F511_40887 [Dorcoceras hygrometricum]|uniref:Uncharacterized protein n=1 Tax=Dorcoceras hygrometricum TaxID=472368 RepID=A0A2Z7D275_9LAMI|nr:hypothetical protein F511_40887 [Dorcoceras hygrometricum]